ncbi:ATP-dependent Clp protease ATP-binding subunit [bacterium CPR1]|nr:ATP-dependent Clp protease ATP-binding subunit [bacterium CPR1]
MSKPQLSLAVQVAWGAASYEAEQLRHELLEPEHLWVGICSLSKVVEQQPELFTAEERAELRQGAELVVSELAGLGLTPDGLRRTLRRQMPPGQSNHSGHRSPQAREVFEQAEFLARGKPIEVRHLLTALVNKPCPGFERARAPADSLLATAVDQPPAPEPPKKDSFEPYRPQENVPTRSMRVPGKQTIARDLKQFFEEEEKRRQALYEAPLPPMAAAGDKQGGKSILQRLGRDLTVLARQGKLGPFVGRERELKLVVECLMRQGKNNPVLVGEPGVGKTAVVEALAVEIVRSGADHPLSGKRVVEIAIGQLLAGTTYRGEFEENISQLIREASNPSVILFIDELHTLIGSGSYKGSSQDGADLLKPALARGALRLIGATTVQEYEQFIQTDPALERRLDKVAVEEPLPAEALAMVQGLVGKLASHHQLEYLPEALEAAVELSVQFVKNRRLPDKAIDLLDRAGARARAERRPAVDRRVVAETLASVQNLPLELILSDSADSRMLTLEAALKQRMVGQDEAIDKLCQRLALVQAGLIDRRGPLGVFLLIGPPGVGKTEIARTTAEHLFGTAEALVRLDMSEYQEPHSVSRLVGSPPGYVGHDEPSPFFTRLVARPHAVVLLDEVEKAHARVFDLFLQVFDEGRLTNARGQTVDLRQAIFLLTSNLVGRGQRALGLRQKKDDRPAPPPELAEHFRRELLDRIDEVITLRPLEQSDAETLIRRLLVDLEKDLDRRFGVRLKVLPEVVARVAREGLDPETGGVRGLRRGYELSLLVPLSKRALAGDFKNGDVLRVSEGEKGLELRVVSRLKDGEPPVPPA